jgi:hypothetical protein
MGSPATESAMTTNENKPTALAAFVARKGEIDEMLQRLQAFSDDHFGYGPDEITWGHVGTIADWAVQLRRITDSAFKEGEHAETRTA